MHSRLGHTTFIADTLMPAIAIAIYEIVMNTQAMSIAILNFLFIGNSFVVCYVRTLRGRLLLDEYNCLSPRGVRNLCYISSNLSKVQSLSVKSFLHPTILPCLSELETIDHSIAVTSIGLNAYLFGSAFISSGRPESHPMGKTSVSSYTTPLILHWLPAL